MAAERSSQEQPALTRCPMETTLDIIGNKWKPMILFCLIQDKQRFGELQRQIPGVNRQMLTQHLRELEAHGIVHREVYQEIPPKVEYSLTPTGQTLIPILQAMTDWGTRYLRGEFTFDSEVLEEA